MTEKREITVHRTNGEKVEQYVSELIQSGMDLYIMFTSYGANEMTIKLRGNKENLDYLEKQIINKTYGIEHE